MGLFFRVDKFQYVVRVRRAADVCNGNSGDDDNDEAAALLLLLVSRCRLLAVTASSRSEERRADVRPGPTLYSIRAASQTLDMATAFF